MTAAEVKVSTLTVAHKRTELLMIIAKFIVPTTPSHLTRVEFDYSQSKLAIFSRSPGGAAH